MIKTAPVVLIFRAQLLPPSETFIQSQAAFMKTFRPFFVGRSRVAGIDLPADSFWVASKGGSLGRLQELRFRILGPNADCLRRLRALEPKILHGHFGPDACEVMPLAKKLGVPLITTFHGFDATLSDSALRETRQGRRYLRQMPGLRARGKLFLAVSQFMAKQVEERGFPADRVHVHYIGVDTEKFRPPAAANRKRQVLFVGRLVEKKGCEYAIRAMGLVQKEMPDVEFVIVGDGPLRNSLQELAKTELRQFKFTGVQTAENIREWMSTASVLCSPSIVASSGDAEGFGLVFIEAQSSGVPVVSFASGGVPEAVRHGQTGYLAAEKDWRALAGYIAKLLTDADQWASFSRAGRAMVKSEFNIDVQTDKLERFYEGVIAENQSAKSTGA
jgi:colanic acid/amylovoran biosynthesis glycosyltransferase